MKRLSMVIMVLFLFAVLTGCSDGANSQASGGAESTAASVDANKSVDIDLTALSSTMVYSEVYNMTMMPQDYVGKKIKVGGLYSPSLFEGTGKYYHYVLVADAAACCQQGLEFIWDGEHTYPGDYPGEGSEIQIEGVFSSYEELGEVYYYILTDEISA